MTDRDKLDLINQIIQNYYDDAPTGAASILDCISVILDFKRKDQEK